MTSLIPITPPDQFASHILQLHTAVDEEQPGMVNEIGSLFCDPRICLRLTCSNKLLGFFSHFVGDGGPPGPQQRRGVRTRRHLGAPALQQFEERSEEHTSELQSPDHLVCRLLLEKKKKINV